MKHTLKIMAVAAAIAVPAAAQAEAGDVLLRARAIMVAPTEKSGGILPAFPTEGVSVNNSVMPEVDITYMAADNIGFELIAATTKHSASGKTGVTGGIGKLASTWVLPPTLTVQYHLAPAGQVRPYVGVGVNWTAFYSEKPTAALEAAVGKTSVKMKSSWGWAAQAGVDIPIGEKTFLNLDVKYIDIDTTAKLVTARAGTQQVRVSLDPVVVGIGIGFKL